ncbi:acetophenone carboxylase subunit epsilon [Nevskia ramosa]|uniref:acetophenone carboxylase subunit epsilon n=1 Tax=Nevskia ramosa TaxID=64002 RepID=UPI003D14FBE7
MSTAPAIPWRRRLSELGRGVGKPHAPLFAPLLYGVAAQIEALPPAEVTADPTRLGKCLGELRRALGTHSFVVAAPTAMEAEALGAEVDRETWPPRVLGSASPGVIDLTDFDEVWSRSEALAASIEATRRLAKTQSGEPVLLAALTGPAGLLAELLGEGAVLDAAAYEFAGRALAALARQYAQAGASAILLCERQLPGDVAAWSGTLNTIANIARFHRIPALLAFDGCTPLEWPSAVIACPAPEHEAAHDKPHGLTVAADPASWADLAGNTGSARVVFTAREVDADASIETLTEACEAALDMERDA